MGNSKDGMKKSGTLVIFVIIIIIASSMAIFEVEKGTRYPLCPAVRTKALCQAGNFTQIAELRPGKCWWYQDETQPGNVLSLDNSECVGFRFRDDNSRGLANPCSAAERALGGCLEDSPSPYKSLLHTFWFTVTTITTVGYGDMSPTSPLGQAIFSFIMIFLVMVFSIVAVAIFPPSFESARQDYVNKDIERAVFTDLAHWDEEHPVCVLRGPEQA